MKAPMEAPTIKSAYICQRTCATAYEGTVSKGV